MKPKELIIKSLQEKVSPVLSELGFIFSKSGLRFSRKWDDFTHWIQFSSNRYNEEDICVEFHTSFAVSSKFYAQWHLTEYGEKPVSDSVAGEMDWNLKGWTYPIYKTAFKAKFDIVKVDDRKKVLDILLSNIIHIGIPYLEKHSDWKVAADGLTEKNWLHSKACDFYLIAEDKAKAYESLKTGQKLSNNFFSEEPEKIRVRLRKHFNE